MSPCSSLRMLQKRHFTGFSLFSFVDFWLITNHRRGKGLGSKVSQFILNLIVM
jgi:hypothetical protein